MKGLNKILMEWFWHFCIYQQIGSWAGNLMLTHDQDNFPSDVFTIMEAAGATVSVGKEFVNCSSNFTP